MRQKMKPLMKFFFVGGFFVSAIVSADTPDNAHEYYRVSTAVAAGPFVDSEGNPRAGVGSDVEYYEGPTIIIRNINYPGNVNPNYFCRDFDYSFTVSGSFTQTFKLGPMPESNGLGHYNYDGPSLVDFSFDTLSIDPSYYTSSGTVVRSPPSGLPGFGGFSSTYFCNMSMANRNTSNGFYAEIESGDPTNYVYTGNYYPSPHSFSPYGLALMLHSAEPVEADCEFGNSEPCCEIQATESCRSLGGVYSFIFDNSEGTCSWLCSDDVDDDDPPPGTNPGDGGGNGDGDGGGNGGGNGGGDSLTTEDLVLIESSLQQIADNTAGIDGIADLLQQLVDRPDFDDQRIIDALNSLELTADIDLSGLEASSSGVLSYLQSIFSASGDVPDPSAVTYESPFAGVTDSGNYTGSDTGFYSLNAAKVLDDAGVDRGAGLSDLELEVVDLDGLDSTFSRWISPVECPDSITLDFGGLGTYDFNMEPMCNIMTIVGYLVMFSAWFSVPFIIFATKK